MINDIKNDEHKKHFYGNIYHRKRRRKQYIEHVAEPQIIKLRWSTLCNITDQKTNMIYILDQF